MNAPVQPGKVFSRVPRQKEFKIPAVDPMLFLVDDEIREFKIDMRKDLTGTLRQACPIVAAGVFIVHEHVVPDNTGEVVSNIFPHCWVRTNVGSAPDNPPSESVRLMTPEEVAGFAIFDFSKDNNQPYIVETTYNPPTIAATPNNTAAIPIRGSTWLSVNQPLMENVGLRNTLSMIFLPPKSIFRVTFRIAPLLPYVADVPGPPDVPASGGIPNPLVIGAGGDDTSKRVDFAGACVTGVRLPFSTYMKLKNARLAGLLGL